MALFICLADAFILGWLKAWQQTSKKTELKSGETQTQRKTSGTHLTVLQTGLCQYVVPYISLHRPCK